jgi:hypothetical protein
MAELPAFETASITEGAQGRCQDKVAVTTASDRVVIAVADGAGGSGGGEEAAATVIDRIGNLATEARNGEWWSAGLGRIDLEVGTGQSTGVVVELSANRICGASVGDSRAWIVRGGQIVDLTASQQRKPLLGSGEARPVGFSYGPLDGLLVVATDGFCNYIKRPALFAATEVTGFSALPRRLVDLVRLPSGALWDDVGIVVCRRKRPVTRYSGRIELAFEDIR